MDNSNRTNVYNNYLTFMPIDFRYQIQDGRGFSASCGILLRKLPRAKNSQNVISQIRIFTFAVIYFVNHLHSKKAR